jgi:hypothetical protein
MSIDWSKYGIKEKDSTGIDWSKYKTPTKQEKWESGLAEEKDLFSRIIKPGTIEVGIPNVAASISAPLGVTKKQMETAKTVQPVQTTKEELPGRDIPVLGSVFRALDKVGDAVEGSGVGPLMRSFYVPGAGGANVSGLVGAAENVASKIVRPGTATALTSGLRGVQQAPVLGSMVLGQGAKKAIEEAAVGVPLGIGQYLATQGSSGKASLSDAAMAGVDGALLGGAIGAAAPEIGAGIKNLSAKLSNNLRKGKNAVETVVQEADAVPSRIVETVPENRPAAVEPVQQTQRTQLPVEPNERGLVTTLRESGKLTPEVKANLEASPVRTYDPITNAATVQRANQLIDQGLDVAEASVLGAQGRLNADKVATGFRLIDEYQKAGNVQKAVTLAENLAKQLTEAGQTVQAASIWNRLTPEGALVAATRKVEAINQKLPKGAADVVLTEKNANDIMTAAQAIQRSGVSKERAGNVIEILDNLKAGKQVTVEEKKIVTDFIKDAKQFVKPEKTITPRVAKTPKELTEPRVRDKVVSFMDEAEKAAMERINARRNRLSSTPFDEWADYAIVGASKLVKGGVKFADWSEDMLRTFGEEIKPHLETIFEQAQERMKLTSRYVSKGQLEKAAEAANRITSSNAENEFVSNFAASIKNALDKAKSGDIEGINIDELKSMAQDIVDSAKPGKPTNDEKKILQSAKRLAKKLTQNADEVELTSPSEQVREFNALVRQVAELADEGIEKGVPPKIDKEAIESLSYRLFERAKPSQAEKVATSYLKKNEAKLMPEDIEMVRELAKSVSELSGDAQRAASQDLQVVLNGFERAGVGQKLSSAQYISMLLNPKTQIRNIVGNELLYRIERIQRMAATPIDFAVSKLTGKDRQITFSRGPMSWDNFFSPTRTFMKGIKEGAVAGARGVNPDGLTTAYDISGQAFKSKLNPLTYLEKALGATMKGFDYAAYNRAVDGRLREMAYLDAINSGVKGKQAVQAHIDRYMTNLDDNIASVAKEFGQYITLQDETTLSRSLSRLKRGANKLTTGSENFGVGSLVIPFAKTPANLLLRAIDYSPAGFAKSITQGYQILRIRNTDLTRADVIQSLTRALFGTGLSGVGVWLSSKGALRGETSPDVDVRELEKAAGLSQYQLNASAVGRMFDAMVTGNLSDVDKAAKPQPGDTFYQYEWAQPTSIPLALGANIINERRQAAKDLLKTGKTEGLPKQATDVTLGALNTLFNTSVLQGIQQSFEFAPGESNKVKAFAINVLKQIPTMATPSFISQINQVMDNKLRENYSPDFTEGLLNPAKSRVPGVAQGMEQKVGTLGQPQTRLDNVFDVFLNPAQRSVYKPTKEAQMVMELLSDTGDDTLAPRRVAKYITGTDPVTRAQKRVDLTTEQYVRYQTIVGQEVAKQLGRIPDNATTQTKVKRIKDILTDAGEKGRKQMKKELNLR